MGDNRNSSSCCLIQECYREIDAKSGTFWVDRGRLIHHRFVSKIFGGKPVQARSKASIFLET